MHALAFQFNAARTTSLGITLQPSTVPLKSRSQRRMRWRLSERNKDLVKLGLDRNFASIDPGGKIIEGLCWAIADKTDVGNITGSKLKACSLSNSDPPIDRETTERLIEYQRPPNKGLHVAVAN